MRWLVETPTSAMKMATELISYIWYARVLRIAKDFMFHTDGVYVVCELSVRSSCKTDWGLVQLGTITIV